MNPYSHGASCADSCTPATLRLFLPQAVDHYPRLAAFSLTLVLPYRKTLADYRALILRFHAEVWQRTAEDLQKRQQARKSSLLTLLRWIREATCVPECNMVLMMDLNTPEAGAVHPGVSNITPVALRRSGRGALTTPFSRW
ncbi:DUF3296 domain-containing protein [Enterobacter mori]